MNLTYVYCENVTRLAPVEIYEWINILLIEKSFSIVLLNLLNLRIAGQTYLDSHKQALFVCMTLPSPAASPSSEHLDQAEPTSFFLSGVWRFALLSDIWVWFMAKAGLWLFHKEKVQAFQQLRSLKWLLFLSVLKLNISAASWILWGYPKFFE